MSKLAIPYQHIADILSFETSSSQLEASLRRSDINWEAIVKEGSQHYVIPAIYCRLKAKQLLHVLPDDLTHYLEYIYNENRKRNVIILNQIQDISQLLNSHNIEHTFLKGAALLASGCYNDIAERMLGDIDILVKSEQLPIAFELLVKESYTPTSPTLGHHFFEHKHLPRLKTKVTNRRIAAVEIHKKLFSSYTNDELRPQSIFNTKRQSKSVYIPSQKHLLMHNILNYQINDNGLKYNSINFRSSYDTIVLFQGYSDSKAWYKIKIFNRYFKYASLFFEDIKKETQSTTDLYTHFYLFKLKHLRFYQLWNKLIKVQILTPIFLNRLWLYLTNATYRKAINQDKSRILTHLKSIFKNF